MIKNKIRNVFGVYFYKNKKYFNILIRSVPKKFIYGKVFYEKLKYLKKSQFYPLNLLKKEQLGKLKKILIYSYENVDYYNEIFRNIEFNPYKFSNLSDLENIPYLTKELIKENMDSLISIKIPKNQLIETYTGGSSGEPLKFYQDIDCKKKEKAFIYSIWRRIGYKIGDRVLELRGRVKNKNQLFFIDHLENKLVISSFKLNEENISDIMKLIIKFKPKYLHGYPSNCYLLAKILERNNFSYKFKGIFCGSEKLFEYQRKFLESYFHCRVISWYGHSEYCVLAAECEYSNYYHVFPEYGYTEFIESGEHEGLYEIVATGFNNYAMPFIRYRTGDYAVLANEKCNCGRNYRLIKKIVGREQDFILTKDRTAISVTGLIFGQHYEAFSKIKKFQLFQDELGRVEFMIKPTSKEYKNSIEKEFRSHINKIIGNNLDITIIFTDKFHVTSSGKTPFLIQKINIEKELNENK